MWHSLGHGISCIDTGYLRDGGAACYLVQRDGEAAIIDTGTAPNADRVMRALQAHGLAPDQVRYVMPTHVHLDHAGGAGELMHLLPQATLVVHPRGAPHLIDPQKLVAGTEAVYGRERTRELYGLIRPVPTARVSVAEDGSRWALGNDTLLARDAPGHARHHLCLWDERSRGWFTGDAAGLSYPELATHGVPCVLPTTTPVQFDPDAMIRSVGMLMAMQPAWFYLTHFGRIAAIAEVADALARQVGDYVRAAQATDDADALRAALEALGMAEARRCGCALPDAALRALLAPDMDLNMQGLLVWRAKHHAA